MIRKRQTLSDDLHYRFYSVMSPDGFKITSIPLDNYPELVTERDLLLLIFTSWGAGEYIIYATAKGRKGFFVFWRGIINEKGFLFHKKEYNRKALAEWNDILDLNEPDDKALLQNIKQEEMDKKRKQLYGFVPFLQPSGRRGQFNFWNDSSFSLKSEDDKRGEDWGSPNKKSGDEGWIPNKIKPENWGANKSKEDQW